jgi:hypothetical protein
MLVVASAKDTVPPIFTPHFKYSKPIDLACVAVSSSHVPLRWTAPLIPPTSFSALLAILCVALLCCFLSSKDVNTLTSRAARPTWQCSWSVVVEWSVANGDSKIRGNVRWPFTVNQVSPTRISTRLLGGVLARCACPLAYLVQQPGQSATCSVFRVNAKLNGVYRLGTWLQSRS